MVGWVLGEEVGLVLGEEVGWVVGEEVSWVVGEEVGWNKVSNDRKQRRDTFFMPESSPSAHLMARAFCLGP